MMNDNNSIVGNMVMNFIHTLKQRNLEYWEQNKDRYNALKEDTKKNNEKIQEDIEVMRKKHRQKLEEMDVEHKGNIERIKAEQEQETEDFNEYLQSLNELKENMQKTYSHIPRFMIHNIYYHAKILLLDMRKAPDYNNKYRKKLINLMNEVHKDINLIEDVGGEKRLPIYSIKFIDENFDK